MVYDAHVSVVYDAGVVEHGGSVVYDAHVRHILMEDGGGTQKAVGVRLADGREFRAKVGPLS